MITQQELIFNLPTARSHRGLLPRFLPKPFDSSDVCRLRTGVERRHTSPAGSRMR